MKRAITLLLALLMLALCMAGCAKKEAPAPSAAPAATAAPAARSFTEGFDAELQPFGFIAGDGSYDGFDLAVAAEVCKRLGWTFVAQPIAWDSKDAELQSGNIDCIWNGFTIEGRENDYAWTPSYYDSSIVVVVKADSSIHSLADLAGKSVMVQADSSGLHALEDNEELKASFGELLECADYNNAFMELGMGTVDAVVADVGVAEYNLRDKGDQFRTLEEKVSVETYGVGFLKGNDALAQQVWDEILKIAADGTMGTLADKYVSYGLVKENVTILPKG
jgi:polar amino acid transport system substrate-binding protein